MAQAPEDIEPWLVAGRINASPSAGEDVVITGISGCYPESDNIHEFRDNLTNKADMVTSDWRRWESLHPEIPTRAGKIWNVEKFDAGFFGVHQHQCDAVDPMCRIILEKCFECLLDAGINPKEIEGTNTGIFVGACASESEKYWFYEHLDSDACAITGCHRSMLASRVAYALKLQGPAFILDTACSSSFFAFEHAYRSIREGRCDRAIVAGSNLCLHPYVTLQFYRLGVLSLDGACKCFDDAANGYTRSEAICAIVLQKSVEAKRIYAHVIHSKVNSDGYKEQGITYPSGDTQKELIREVYDECQMDPNEISYMEAHGTGTKVGDPEELKAIHEIFLEGRDRPLLIGSVKSNIGHTEPTSGLCSISKIILSYEVGKILPNVNFKTPRKGIEALSNGQLEVITHNTDWPDDRGLTGINSFGFGGANCHTILKWHEKLKSPKRFEYPVLVCVSGRTTESVQTIMDDLKSAKQHRDPEYVRLLHEIFRINIEDHNYRGYILIESNQEKIDVSQEINWCPEINNHRLIYNFNQVTSKTIWNDLNLRRIPLVKEILEIWPGFDAKVDFHLQLLLITIFKALGIKPDDIQGLNSDFIQLYLQEIISLDEVLDNRNKNPSWNQVPKSDQKNVTIVNFGDPIVGTNYINIFSGLNLYVTIGKMYLTGISINLSLLYPKVEFPVSRGTPMISPLIKWDHTKNWYVTKYTADDIQKTGFVYMALDLKDENWKFLSGHVADGRNLFPATGYLAIVWDVLGMMTGNVNGNMKVVFEDVKFLRATNIPSKGTLFFIIMVQRGTGNFEVMEGGVPIVTGTVRELKEDEELTPVVEQPSEDIILNQRDIYTELKLRGYNYRDAFKGLNNVTLSCRKAEIDWTGNWVTFLDNMLQMQILQLDSRSLYVPTGIQRIVIDALNHNKEAENVNRMSVWAYKELGCIRTSFIEIRGVLANVINRKILPDPVVEKYVFVPNQTTLDLQESVRVIMQIALENYPMTKLKIIEHFEAAQDPQVIQNCSVSLFVREALDDLPLIEADIRIFTKTEYDPGTKAVQVSDSIMGTELDCYLIVLHEHFVPEKMTKVLKPHGFVIINSDNERIANIDGFNILVQHRTPKRFLTLYQRQKPELKTIFVEYLLGKETEVLTKVKNTVKSKTNLVLYTRERINGLVGFTNCLRKEPSVLGTLQCLIIDDSNCQYNDDMVKEQLAKQMMVNIRKGETWGTLRHLSLTKSSLVRTDHVYGNVVTRGDLSTLSWIQGPITKSEENLIHVCYGAVNFRDVMTASGRVPVDAITNDRMDQQCVQGFEYSGFDSSGKRVMGMLNAGALSTLLTPDALTMLPVPDNWTLEDAVTIPVVYGTVLYAFEMRLGGLLPGQSVLIHSGTGGIGQAAIALALYYKCQVFATVGTEEKKTYLLNKFPQLRPEHIGHSRGTTFETLIMHQTKGRGVDIILNSLSENKLQASLRCLAKSGHFLEIGKFDLAKDSTMDLSILGNGASFHGIMLDGVFNNLPSVKHHLMDCLSKAINDGAIVPLERTTFDRNEFEKAYRYMSNGKHVGKVVIKVRDNPENPDLLAGRFLAVPRYFCPKGKACLVVGGLGGFGLELSDWLVLRGCRNLFITSRTGPRTGYQHLRIKTWKNYGCTVTVITENLFTMESCTRVLGRSEDLDAIFNLAAVLHDGLLEQQTKEQLDDVIQSKYTTTKNLDQLSRIMCPNLRHFVVFSSVSCGRGNIAQVNYGLANSLVETLIENRKSDGFPALAVQWGSIADVGLAAELINDDLNERPIGGTLPQKITSCLELMDQFLSQPETVVASMVVAEKRGSLFMTDNIVNTVINIMGLRDLKTVSLHSTLPELGMDSMMAVEIKQTLEREYEIFLNPSDIRTLTFARLEDLQSEKNPKIERTDLKKSKLENVNHLLRFINGEECSRKVFIPLKSALNGQFTKTTPKVFLLPGVEGFASILETLCSKLHCQTIGLQFTFENPPDTLQDMAYHLVPFVIPHLQDDQTFILIAYSFGSTVALELASILEQSFGLNGQVILIDGAPEMSSKLIYQQTNVNSPSEFETSILCNIFAIYMPLEIVDIYREDLLQMNNFEERVNFVVSKSPETQYSNQYIKKVCEAFHKRVRAVLNYQKDDYLLNSQIVLFKPTRQSVIDLDEDYNLKSYSAKSKVDIKVFDADHYTILDNDNVAEEIDKLIRNRKDTKEVFHKGEKQFEDLEVKVDNIKSFG